MGRHGNDGVPCIPRRSSITGTSPSDCLVSYPEHSLKVLFICIGAIDVFYSYTELNVKAVLFPIIQFSMSTQFRCQNSTISSNLV